MKHLLFAFACLFTFSSMLGQVTNFTELTKGENDIIVKLKKRRNHTYVMRVNIDDNKSLLEERLSVDNRVKERDSRKTIYFRDLVHVKQFLGDNGYHHNPNLAPFWDLNTVGEKNLDLRRHGTAKIMNRKHHGNSHGHSHGHDHMGERHNHHGSNGHIEHHTGIWDHQMIAIFSKGHAVDHGMKEKTCAADCAKGCCTGQPMAFHSVYFDTDMSAVSIKDLHSVGHYMNENPNTKMHVIGHADKRGDMAYNKSLGMRRAKACVALLEKEYHIAAHRLVAKSNGERKDFEELAKNRRVDFVVAE